MREQMGRDVTLIPAILLGGYINTVWAARSLAKAGIELTALADGVATPYVRYSRHLARFFDVPNARAAQELWWDCQHPGNADRVPSSPADRRSRC